MFTAPEKLRPNVSTRAVTEQVAKLFAELAKSLRLRGVPAKDVEAICYGNALKAFGQSGQMKEEHWLNPAPVDQRMLFEGNSVLRGQTPKFGEVPSADQRAGEVVFK